MNHALFPRFESAIRRYAGNARAPELLLAADGPLSCYYAPFDWKNPQARVLVLGITPGLTQAANALAVAHRELAAGAPAERALQVAKKEGAFSGAIRPNLVALLDRIGLQHWLGIGSCASLFGADAHLLQSASVLPYPVYVGGANYNGAPDIVRTPLLRQLALEHFLPFVQAATRSVIVPLGPVPTKALEWLAVQGHVDPGRVLAGLPHPSGANAERVAYFLGTKARSLLSAKTDPAKLDAARHRLVEQVAALPR